MFIRKLVKITVILVILLVWPTVTMAAVLYLEPETGVYGPGDSLGVAIKLDVDTGCINTIESTISFPSEVMLLVEFVTGESFLSLWIDKPESNTITQVNQIGEIYFAGGIPGGYCGRIPGDPGESNIVGRMIFKIPGLVVSDQKPEYLDIKIQDNSRVLLNDGLGTEDNLKLRHSRFRFAPKAVVPEQDWEAYIQSDDISPEPFIVELHQDPNVFNGSYYIIFSTVDKQTGVDHYEVLEIRVDEQIGAAPEVTWWKKLLGKERPVPDWQSAKMPYLLKDQTLTSVIKVKAIDKAGNERLVEYIPSLDLQTEAPTTITRELLLVIIGGGSGIILILIIIIFLIYKRRSKQQTHEDTEEENTI